MPTNYFGRLATIFAVILLALWAIFPSLPVDPLRLLDPSVPFSQKHNLKPGIDMVGGTSLLYEIQVPEGADSTGLSTAVMDALKRRVDPDGVRNLVWRPQGDTRLEIQMPLSGRSRESVQIRDAYARAQTQLEGLNVRPAAVLDAVQRLSGQARAERLAQLALDSRERQEVFAEIARVWDELQAARERRDAEAQARAELAFEALKRRIEPTNIDVPELEAKLNLIEEAKQPKGRRGEVGTPPKDVVDLVEAIRKRAESFPTQRAALDEFIAAHAAFYRVRSQLDEAADLKRLLQGSGVLEFHILVEARDPRVPEMVERLLSGAGAAQRSGDTARWASVDKPETMDPRSMGDRGVIVDYAGRRWVLLDIRPEKSLTQQTGAKWALERVQPGRDPQTGEQEILFTLDAQGGRYMSRLTGANIGRPMAIVLDNRVISAPTIQSQISSNGRITGRYTNAEIRYLVNTLSAGSLPAQLSSEPISERTVGPQLGADNLRRGLISCFIGLMVVATFLIGYYYIAGAVALVAVTLNLFLIIGALAGLGATFTLPSIAALVLTLGASVDANVLIFERLREEQERGFPIRNALRNAYDRAFSAILDSNVVTAITSVVLYVFGSEEVKGFGLTLLVGIATSLFTALYVTRTLFAILVDKFGVRRLGAVPMTFPAWARLLRPNINWMGRVWLFGGASVALLVVGLTLFVHYIRQGRLFDIEFSSGTAVTLELKQPVPQEQIRRMLADAADRTVVVAGATDGDAAAVTERRTTVGEALPAALPVAVGEDNLTWEIVTPNADVPAVRAAVLEVFGDLLQINVPSTFNRVGLPFDQVIDDVVFEVEARPPPGRYAPESWGEFRGGVAIYLENLSPPLTPEQIQARITNQRLQPGVGQTRPLPPVTVYAVGGPTRPTTEALVLAVDPRIIPSEDREKWQREVAEPVWRLVNEAINRPPSLAKVSSFNPSVAAATQQDAAVAITLALLVIMAYIWMRFGNLRYGTATVIALLHDTLFVLAALGFAHLLYDTFIGELLLLEPFRINLTVVAGILTVMGYSMSDTIVIFDRIRELRGQRGVVTPQLINDAVNQTLSRTLLTSGTTIATLMVMYIFGGPGIHGFTYVLLVGILVGTYSSIAIAAPLLLVRFGRRVDATPPDATRATPAPAGLQQA
ncbi:MAG: protein translocase subunit SecD [Tepidisphaerales bacterium]